MLIALAASATAFADPIKGGASDRTAIPSGDAIQIDSTEGNKYTAGDGVKVGSLTEIDGSSGGVNIAAWAQNAGLTVDANSESAKTAIKVSSWKQNFTTTTITNSVSSTAATTVDFGESLTLSANYNSQSQYLYFRNVYAKVFAKSTSLQERLGASIVSIFEGSKVDWSGSIRLGEYYNQTNNAYLIVSGELNLQKYNGTQSRIDVYDGATFSINSTGVFKSADNTVNIYANGTLSVSGKMIMQGGSTISIGGTFNLQNKNPTERFVAYGMNSTGGTFFQAAATGVDVDCRGIEIKRSATLSRNTTTKTEASWDIDSRLDLKGDYNPNVSIDLTTAKLTVNDNSKIRISDGEEKFVMWSISKAYLNTENAIVDGKGKGNITLISADAGKSATVYTPELHITANQQFSNIWLGSDLKIFLDDNNATLKLTKVDGTTISGFAEKFVEIYNFTDNKIFVGTNDETLAQISRIKAYDSDNNLLKVTVSDTGWLTAVIPEPAEWAAIFGAFALAVAVYRRRK